MLCPRQGANCCYIDNVKLLPDLIKNDTGLCSDCCSLYGDPNFKLWPLVNLNEQ